MILNHNSISAKLYRWFYETNIMPNNLCPYFWKLAIAYTFALPLLILTLPHTILNNGRHSSTPRIAYSILFYSITFIVISMLSVFGLFFVTPEENTFYLWMVLLGLIAWSLVFGFGICKLISALIIKWKSYRYYKKYFINKPKTAKVNLIVEMVKAKYHKYCPKIDWTK
jgi:hypothetical protein